MSQINISDSQKQFIISSINNNIRIDGRPNNQPPKINVKTNILDHLLGSCLLTIHNEDNQLTIYTGIKLKIEKLSTNQQNCQINKSDVKDRVQLELGCIKKLSQQEEQVRLQLEQYLRQYIVLRYLDQFQQILTIYQAKKHCLSMNIEVYLLNVPHISFLEYLFVCAKTALKSLRFPEFTVTYNEITNQETIQTKQTQQFSTESKKYKGLQNLRIVGLVGESYVLGMTVEEYDSVDSCILITSNIQDKVQGFETLKGKLKVEDIHRVIKFGRN